MTLKQSLLRQSDGNRPAVYRVILLLSLGFLLGLFTSKYQAFNPSSVSLPFYSPLFYESSQKETIQLCSHILLFSSARHGSTWFIDSADNCRYSMSAPEDKPFSNTVFLMTEPWKHEKSSFANMSGIEVADHVRKNASVKIFSSTLANFRPRVEELLESAGRSMDIPVVILRRDPRSTFSSFQLASETKNWNTRKDSEKVIKIDHDKEKAFQGYKAYLERYFADVQNLIAEKNVTRADIIDYDDIKDLEYIKLKNNDCYIRNCNFRDVDSKTE